MQTISAFRPAHGDVVHDLQYDFYAKRLATASADQHIKVWELITDSEDGSSQWVLAEDWKVCCVVRQSCT
jgi:nucleoporin SEH1